MIHSTKNDSSFRHLSSAFYLPLCAFCLLLFSSSCKDSGIDPPPGYRDTCIAAQEFLSFEDKFALRLAFVDPYLYVCAGMNGVWRRNVDSKTAWEYLGLKDTSLGNYTNVGAIDMDVLGQDILVAYNRSTPETPPESSVAVWRSLNGGMDWSRSDSGIPETIVDTAEYNILTSIDRSPDRSNVLIGWVGSAAYRSTDNGNAWMLVFGHRGVIISDLAARWHLFRSGEVWVFGESAVFSPVLLRLTNDGETVAGNVDFRTLGYPSDGSVDDVAFDAGNPHIIYAATTEGVIRTTDDGGSWQKDAIKLPDYGYGFVFRMACHPSISGILFLAGGKRVYWTRDGGTTVTLLKEIESGFITSLLYNVQRNELFVGTTGGGIFVIKLCPLSG